MLGKLIALAVLSLALSGCQTTQLQAPQEQNSDSQEVCGVPEPPEAFAWLSLSKDEQTYELAQYIAQLLDAFQKCRLGSKSVFRTIGE